MAVRTAVAEVQRLAVRRREGAMSSAVVELILGLVFVFFLFSMLCSGINELIARTLGRRADFLSAGLWSMLDNSQEGEDSRSEPARQYYVAFQSHPLVRQLGPALGDKARAEARGLRGFWRTLCRGLRGAVGGRALKGAMAALPGDPRAGEGDRKRPSYIPPAIFGVVVASFLREENDLPAMPGTVVSAEGEERERGAAHRRRRLGTTLERSLQALVDEAAGDADRLRTSLERWYDAQMERVSGWYKRESKHVLLIIATAVVLSLNVDTVAIARTLWTSPTARSAVADAAQQQIEAAAGTMSTSAPLPPLGGPAAPEAQPSEQPAPAPALTCPGPATATGGPAPTTTAATDAPAAPGAVVAEALDCATSLPIPIGWRLADGEMRNRWDAAWASAVAAFPGGWLLKLLGWGLTVGALSFGAPFWFDLLNRFGSLRAAGTKPKASAEVIG